MKKVLVTLLCLSLLLSAGCSAEMPQVTDSPATTEATAPQKPGAEVVTEEVKAQFDAIVQKHKYEGIVSLTYKGEVIYQSIAGTNDMGLPLTAESPLYMCSTSKQFCAASVLILRDQGKLSLDDRLEKYFPEYTNGKDITLHQLLSMQSGIIRDMDPMWKTPELYENNTPEENEAAFKKWVFEQPLVFTPGNRMEYSNVNYVLLSLIVEIVSGENYEDFVRSNIFEPLNMNNSGFITEVKDNPQWGLTYDNIRSTGKIHLIAQGSGGIITTAGDMDLWLNGLQSGKVLSEQSYCDMTTPHTLNYGYGLMSSVRGGWGHTGANGTYTTQVYFNEEYGFNLFVATGNTNVYLVDATTNVTNAMLKTLFEAVDAAMK